MHIPMLHIPMVIIKNFSPTWETVYICLFINHGECVHSGYSIITIYSYPILHQFIIIKTLISVIYNFWKHLLIYRRKWMRCNRNVRFVINYTKIEFHILVNIMYPISCYCLGKKIKRVSINKYKDFIHEPHALS